MSAEENSLRCNLGNVYAMSQIRDSLPLHTHQHEVGAKTIGQVSLSSTGNSNNKARALNWDWTYLVQGEAR